MKKLSTFVLTLLAAANLSASSSAAPLVIGVGQHVDLGPGTYWYDSVRVMQSGALNLLGNVTLNIATDLFLFPMALSGEPGPGRINFGVTATPGANGLNGANGGPGAIGTASILAGANGEPGTPGAPGGTGVNPANSLTINCGGDVWIQGWILGGGNEGGGSGGMSGDGGDGGRGYDHPLLGPGGAGGDGGAGPAGGRGGDSGPPIRMEISAGNRIVFDQGRILLYGGGVGSGNSGGDGARGEEQATRASSGQAAVVVMGVKLARGAMARTA